VITGPTGTVVETMTYYPYGEVKSDLPGTPVNVPYKYTGKERDSSTGLMYYEARYYDPKLGRFISADTIIPNVRDPQDLNRYTYASNNPFRYTDPTGHFSLKIGKFLNRVFHNPIARAAGWVFCAPCMQFLDPTTRQYTVPVAAGVVGTFACGPVCGGALAGAAGGYVSGRDIGRSTWMGAVAGAVTWGVSAGFNVAGLGDYVVAQAFVASAASGATEAALGGGDVLQAALIGGSVGAVSAYMQSRGMSPAAAQEKAVNAKTSSDLNVEGSNGNEPLLMAQRGGSVRQDPMGRQVERFVDMMDETNSFFGDIRDLRAAGQINNEIRSLQPQVPAGESRLGHIFVDKSTGNVTGSAIGGSHMIDINKTLDVQRMIHGREAPPSFRQGR
jgi:RHS repeat-associated protein